MVRQTILKVFALAVLMLIVGANCSYISAHTENDEVTLVVSGEGTTKDEAIKVALRSAIEQAYGTFVSSNTEILNDELVKDEIVTLSSGNVKEYELLSESNVNDKCDVELKATVSISKLTSYAKSKGSETELSGATFAMNIKLEKLYAKNEETAMEHLTKKMESLFPMAYDFTINTFEPKEIDGQIEVVSWVTVTANDMAGVIYDTFWNTIKGILKRNKKNDYYFEGNGCVLYAHKIHPILKFLDNMDSQSHTAFILSDNIRRWNIQRVYRSVYSNDKLKVRVEFNNHLPEGGIGFYKRGTGVGYKIPILVNRLPSGTVIAVCKIEAKYTLDEIGRISKISVTPLREKSEFKFNRY